MSNLGSNSQVGNPMLNGGNTTRWRYRGICGSLDCISSRHIFAVNEPSKMLTQAMLSGWPGRSMYRKRASPHEKELLSCEPGMTVPLIGRKAWRQSE